VKVVLAALPAFGHVYPLVPLGLALFFFPLLWDVGEVAF